MNTNQNQTDPAGPILALLAIAATFLAVLWAGAQLAALVVHHHPLGPVPLNTFLGFVSKLPKHLGSPADAWPPGPWTGNLTGPVPYWACTAFLLLAAVGLLVTVARVFRSNRDVGQDRQARFGAPAWPREATRADLAPLIVKGPTPGRTILGRAQRRLIATEDRAGLAPKRITDRTGDRGGVLVVGPARSGKTVIAFTCSVADSRDAADAPVRRSSSSSCLRRISRSPRRSKGRGAEGGRRGSQSVSGADRLGRGIRAG